MRFLYWLRGTADSVLMGFIAVVVMVVSIFSYGKLKQNQGKIVARSEDKEADYEHAESIRDRVDRGLSGRMRSFDDSGYRD